MPVGGVGHMTMARFDVLWWWSHDLAMLLKNIIDQAHRAVESVGVRFDAWCWCGSHDHGKIGCLVVVVP